MTFDYINKNTFLSLQGLTPLLDPSKMPAGGTDFPERYNYTDEEKAANRKLFDFPNKHASTPPKDWRAERWLCSIFYPLRELEETRHKPIDRLIVLEEEEHQTALRLSAAEAHLVAINPAEAPGKFFDYYRDYVMNDWHKLRSIREEMQRNQQAWNYGENDFRKWYTFQHRLNLWDAMTDSARKAHFWIQKVAPAFSELPERFAELFPTE